VFRFTLKLLDLLQYIYHLIVARTKFGFWRTPNRPKKQAGDPAAPNNGTLVDSAETDYPIHIEYVEEWWQQTS